MHAPDQSDVGCAIGAADSVVMAGIHAGVRTEAPLPLSDAAEPVTELGESGFISGSDPWLMSHTRKHYGALSVPPVATPQVGKAGLSAVVTAVIALACACALLVVVAVVLWCRCSRHSGAAAAAAGKGRSPSASAAGSRGSSSRSRRAAAASAEAAAADAAVKGPVREGSAAIPAEVQVAATPSAQLTSDGQTSAEARSGAMDIAVDSICEPQLSHRSSGAQVRPSPCGRPHPNTR